MSLLSKWLGEKTGGIIGDKYYPGSPHNPGALPGIASTPAFQPRGFLPAGPTGGFKPNQPATTPPFSGRGPGLDVGDVPILGGVLSGIQDWLTGKAPANPVGADLARKYGYSSMPDAELMQLATGGDQLAVAALMSRYSGPQLQAMGMGSILVKVAKQAAPTVAGAVVGATIDNAFDWLTGKPKKKFRRMNVLNPKALKRADRRVRGFSDMARPVLRDLGFSVSTHRHAKPLKKKKRR